ncbi:D-aspartate oxidase [Gnomoniopsis sp. IMI 355080]|nr:D-aspartate oxidase [Gnomoniopsis sp. IMI 355080]
MDSSSANAIKPITIVSFSAGIIGLNIASILAEKGFGPFVTVVAEYFPGDTSSTYTSPWAGCNFSAISGTDENALKWDRMGYSHLSRLASQCPEKAFVRWTPSIELWDEDVPAERIHHMSEYLKDFRILLETELPQGVKFGVSFSILTINAPEHIKYLRRRLQILHGVSFVRRKLPSIQAAYNIPSTKIVFNCTGLASETLRGVEDRKCYPTRGQVLLVRAPLVRTNMMRRGANYETDGSTYASESESILDRTRKLSLELRQQETEVLAAFTGLRPSREGGARVEREEIVVDEQKRVLVHNYGAGGTGFQAGFGMALESVELVEDLLVGLGHGDNRASL